MYFLLENGYIPASYVSLLEGKTLEWIRVKGDVFLSKSCQRFDEVFLEFQQERCFVVV